MTLEKLLGCSASELKAMSDAELETFFRPYLSVTRPAEAAKRETKTVKIAPKVMDKRAEINRKLARILGNDFKL